MHVRRDGTGGGSGGDCLSDPGIQGQLRVSQRATLPRPQRVRVKFKKKRKEGNFVGMILVVMGGARMVTCAADDAERWNFYCETGSEQR